jgi:hypothetical protein
VISDRRREAVSLGPGIRAHHILWPPSFGGAPLGARVCANALAALVFLTALVQTYLCFYWQDDGQVDDSRYEDLWFSALMMAVPILLMRRRLAHALGDRRGVWPGLVAAAAWISSVLVTSLVLLAVGLTGHETYCSAGSIPPEHPLSDSVLPTAVLVALAAGSAVSWTVWVVSRRRVRPASLYRVWLTTITVTVVVSLAPWLRAAETCRTGA